MTTTRKKRPRDPVQFGKLIVDGGRSLVKTKFKMCVYTRRVSNTYDRSKSGASQ